MHEQPLRPDEDAYRTEVDTESRTPEPEGSPSPAAEPRPWIAAGLILLALFVALLVYAVFLALS
jgi:hypothetical protein